MPQQTANKKVVSSKGGRKISTPVGLLFIAVAAILLAIGGTYGYSRYKARDLQAQAGTWTTIANTGTSKANIQIKACKVYKPGGADEAAKPGTIKFFVSKPKGTKPSVKITLYKNYPIKGGVVPGTTVKNTISSKVVNNWTPVKTIDTNTIRSWWGDEVTGFQIDSGAETITNAKIGLEFTNSATGKRITPPYVRSETEGKTIYVRHYYDGYESNTLNGLIKTDKAFSAAYKHWVTNYSISVPRITNCAYSY